MSARRSRMLRGLIACTLMMFATDLAAQAAADSALVVQPGSRVRVTAMDALRVTGRVEAINDERLFVQPRHGAPVAIPVTSIETVQISRGHRSRTLKGALIGGAAAGLAVATWATLISDAPNQEPGDTQLLSAMAVIPGAIIGTIVGYLTSPERWVPGVVPGGR